MSLQELISVMRSGDVKEVESFLTQHPNFDLNQVKRVKQPLGGDTIQLTPLMIAYNSNNLELVKLLLAKGADVNFKNKHGRNCTVLAKAVEDKNKDVAKLLVENGAHVAYTEGSDLGDCALTIACKQGNLDMVKILLPPHGAKLDPTWAYSKYSVSLHNHNNNMSVGYDCDWSPVNMALSEGHVEVVEWLLENVSDVPSGALHIAINDNDYHKIPHRNHMIKILLDHGAQVNPPEPNALSPLMVASYYGNVEVVKMLLERGAQVNYMFEEKYAGHLFALLLAARQGHADVVKFLLAKGAQVDLRGNKGETALRTVFKSYDLSETKQTEVVKVLLAGGANANLQLVVIRLKLHSYYLTMALIFTTRQNTLWKQQFIIAALSLLNSSLSVVLALMCLMTRERHS